MATTLGALLAMVPWFALVVLLVFAVVAVVTRWVAGASVTAAIVLVGLGLASGPGWTGALGGQGWSTTAFTVVLAAVVVLRHRPNLQAWWDRRRTGSAG